ncbi:MAG: hypothetical protein JWO67_4694 [Streptosporangiaceae bacterium]|nr:hypothetical protein [Streptosporangiaceae bacterium]
MTAVEQYRPAEVVQLDPTGGRLIAWAQAARAANALAESLVRTSFAPKEFRGKPEEATAAIMLGDELGLSPISALRSVYVIHGTPSIYAKTMVALVQAHGHEVWTESTSDREVTVSGRRRGSDRTETAKWDIDRARKAGYTSNAKYQTNPQEMLWAKAASEVCKKIASDVLAGVPFSVEDLELEPENQPTTRVARPPRAIQRQLKPVPPEPEFDESPAPAQEPVKATAERTDDPITPKQLTALNAALSSDLGFTDRDDKLAYLSGALGREIGSSKDVTKAEAMRLLDEFAAARESEPAEPPLDGDWPDVAQTGGAR